MNFLKCIFVLIVFLSVSFSIAGEKASVSVTLDRGEEALGYWNFEKAMTLFEDLLKREDLTRSEKARSLRGRLLTRALILSEYRDLEESYDLFLEDAATLLDRYPEYFDLWCANRVKNPIGLKDDEEAAEKLVRILDSHKKDFSPLDYRLIRGEIRSIASMKEKGKKFCRFREEEFRKARKADPDSYIAWEMFLDVLWDRGRKMSWREKRVFAKMIKKAMEKNLQGFAYSPFHLNACYRMRNGKMEQGKYCEEILKGIEKFPDDPLLYYEYVRFAPPSNDVSSIIIPFLEKFLERHEEGKFTYLTLSRSRIPLSMMYKLGTFYALDGRLEDSIAVYEKIREISPHYAEVHYNIAVVLEKIAGKEEDKDKKRILLERALEQMHLQKKYLFQSRGKDKIQEWEDRLKEKLEEIKGNTNSKTGGVR